MYTARQLNIIAFLISSKDWIQGNELAKKINVSNRTIQHEIKAINQTHPEQDLILSNNRLGYKLEEASIPYLQTLPSLHAVLYQEDPFSIPSQILLVLLFSQDYITIGYLADHLYLSKSTINTNLKIAKRIIERTINASLSTTSKGIKLIAPENLKRIIVMKLVETPYDYAMVTRIPSFDRIHQYQQVLSSALATIFVNHNLISTGEAFHDFAKYLSICILRSQLGFLDEEDIVDTGVTPIVQEIVVVASLQLHYTYTSIEIKKIKMRLQEINLLEAPLQQNQKGMDILQRFQQSVFLQTGFWLQFPYEVKATLAEHLERMTSRVESGRNNRGHDTDELFTKFPLAIHLLKTCLLPILDLEVAKAELSYLIYFLVAAIQSNQFQMSVLFVSDEGAGNILYAKEELKKRLQGFVNTITCIPSYVFFAYKETYQKDYHIFLTTDQGLALKDTSFLLLNSILVPEQLEGIRKKLYHVYEAELSYQIAQFERFQYPERHIKSRLTLSTLLDALQDNLHDAHISLESIGNHRLCILSHSNDASFIQCLYLAHPLNYKRKSITKILFAHYGKEGDIISFFSFIQQKIEAM